jgi:hypothetical protein
MIKTLYVSELCKNTTKLLEIILIVKDCYTLQNRIICASAVLVIAFFGLYCCGADLGLAYICHFPYSLFPIPFSINLYTSAHHMSLIQ